LIGRSFNLKKSDPIIGMSRRVGNAPAIQEATPASRMAAAVSGPGAWFLTESPVVAIGDFGCGTRNDVH